MDKIAEVQDSNLEGTCIVVSRPDGRVVGQSRAARALLGTEAVSAEKQACWIMMHQARGAQGLPCSEGCVSRCSTWELPVESHSISLHGRTFELRCEPVGDQVVTTLRPTPDPPPSRCQPLTPREIEVLQLLANGLDGTEIAAALEISPGTVRTHVEHMRERLECRTRAGLVAKGYRLRYLD